MTDAQQKKIWSTISHCLERLYIKSSQIYLGKGCFKGPVFKFFHHFLSGSQQINLSKSHYQSLCGENVFAVNVFSLCLSEFPLKLKTYLSGELDSALPESIKASVLC